MICISGIGAKSFSVFMIDVIPSLDFINKTQCFPLYWFDRAGALQEGITNSTLDKFRNYYKDSSSKKIEKEDIFYYIYGLLHSEDYQGKYKFNLSKSLPYIPLTSEFWQFSDIGRKLAELHLNYEHQKPTKEIKFLKHGKSMGNKINFSELNPEDLKVKKMKVDKKDETKIQFNDSITISNIPKEAWDYKINGWSAPKWIVERYQYKQDKKTDIVNDPNTYSEDPAYILKLLLSVITVSLKTQELVQSLPSIDFDKIISKKEAA